MPRDVEGAESCHRPNNLMEKFVVEARTQTRGDTASDIDMPGSQMCSGESSQ